MTIQEVTTRQHERQFDALPHRLHRDAPAYIGALDNEVDAVFDPRKNKLLAAGGDARRWLLLDKSNASINYTVPPGADTHCAGFWRMRLQSTQKLPEPTDGFSREAAASRQAAVVSS